MKRQMFFKYDNGNYIITEGGQIVFSIDGSSLKFISLDFYNGIYGGENKSTSIDFKNEIDIDPTKKGNYIYEWLFNIIASIEKEIPVSAANDLSSDTEIHPHRTKVILLYEMSACAGDGFYFGQEGVPSNEYSVSNMEADYAVKISGESMEPTIKDGSIVLVKATSKLFDGDIGIFNIDGNIMCKRYTNSGDRVILVPDNTSSHFKLIEVTKNIDFTIQGKVLV